MIALAREAHAPVALAIGLIGLGTCRGNAGHTEEGVVFFREAAELLDRCGHRRAGALAHTNLGTLHLRLGRFEAARRSYETARNLFQDLSSPRHMALLNLNMGRTHHAQGELDEAEAAGRVALQLAEDAAHSTFAAYVFLLLAEVAMTRQQPARAWTLLQRGLALEALTRFNRAMLLSHGALAAAESDAHDDARSALEAVEPLLASIPPAYQCECYTLTCRAWSALGESERARHFLKRAEAMHRAMVFAPGSLPYIQLQKAREACC